MNSVENNAEEWLPTGRFAALAGVTIRTLRHYDQLGLLRVSRTASGYRRYRTRDLERIQQIVALKSLGMSLPDIARATGSGSQSLAEVLERQRGVLVEKRELLDRAIRVIGEVQTAISTDRSTTGLLRKLIEVMQMQNDSGWMMKYYSPEAQAKLAERAKSFTAEDQAKASEDWKAYYRDLAAMTAEGDPDGSRATALAARHQELLGRFTGNDPDIEAGLAALHRDRANWPQHDDQRMREYEAGQ